MGLLSTLKGALGLQKPLVPADPKPFAFTDAGQARLDSLAEGHGVHVSTSRSAHGRLVSVEEGELQGPSPAGYTRLTIGDKDLQRLRGLLLDFEDDAWRVSTHLELHARETPNPHGRLYLCNRFLAEGRVFHFTSGEADAPALAALFLTQPAIKSVLFRDNTVTVERDPDIPWDAIDQAVNVALRTHFLSVGHRLTGEVVAQGGLLAQIQTVLEQTVLPGIHRDGGDLQLLGFDDGVLKVSMHGACRTCPASSATLKLGVERVLKDAFGDQIRSVEQVEA